MPERARAHSRQPPSRSGSYGIGKDDTARSAALWRGLPSPHIDWGSTSPIDRQKLSAEVVNCRPPPARHRRPSIPVATAVCASGRAILLCAGPPVDLGGRPAPAPPTRPHRLCSTPPDPLPLPCQGVAVEARDPKCAWFLEKPAPTAIRATRGRARDRLQVNGLGDVGSIVNGCKTPGASKHGCLRVAVGSGGPGTCQVALEPTSPNGGP
jgi:hypothetical protein